MTPPCDPSPPWQIKLLYDGECPLCLREVNFLRHRDGGQGRVAFVDIADLDYRPEEHGDIPYETAMGRIHALGADGRIIQNVEVFRQVYSVLGIGWIYAATGWPWVGPIVDAMYSWWADRRLAWTGRGTLDTLVREREHRLRQRATAGGCGCAEVLGPPKPGP